MEEKKPVLVTTKHRGVYFGYTTDSDIDLDKKTIKLSDMRHVYSWESTGSDEDGVYALAKVGPADGSRIGPPVDVTITGLANITRVTPEAEARFLKSKWTRI